MKIVINTCFGGFGISDAGILRIAELKDIKLYPEIEHGFTTYYLKPKNERTEDEYSVLIQYSLERTDPALIQTIEELGSKANGSCAELRIVEIPDDVQWQIAEYDGSEHIAEVHRTWG